VDGGAFGFLGLIHRHRGAVEYDWRTRFGLGLFDIGRMMSIHEAARLAEILLHDPSSETAAAVQGWDYPISREALVNLDLFDLTLLANSDPKKPKPKPHGMRPFKAAKTETQYGNAGGRSREQVEAILAAARDGYAATT
jgi:hypothetical protein